MTLPPKKIKLLREFVNFSCEDCNRHERDAGTLEVHRIHRGVSGGKYTLNNLKMVCKECHKTIHHNEF